MFQLFELILTSPIGALIVTGLQDAIYAAVVISDCADCGFNDLGKMLFGGLILALLTGVGVSILWLRLKGRDTRTSGFVSIRSTERK